MPFPPVFFLEKNMGNGYAGGVALFGMERRIRFTLHTHESTASGDSGTPAEALAEEYARRGFDLVGFVGHDKRPDIDTDTLPVEAITGIEHEVETEPRRVHIVSFPEENFSYLAHPSLSHPEDTLGKAIRTADQYDVDAIEVFNRGNRELPETLPSGMTLVANDDAHNTHQIGGSFMEAAVRDVSAQSAIRAINRGEAQLFNPGYGRLEYAAGRLHQGINLVADGEL